MRRRPEHLAWLILLLSFGLCVLLSVAVPSAAAWFIANATVEVPASLEAIGSGTVLVRRFGTDQAVGATQNPFAVGAGDQVRTDAAARALLFFGDGSNIELRPQTAVTLLESRLSRFNRNLSAVAFRLEAGRLIISVGLPETSRRWFRAQAGGAQLSLQEGSYLLDMGREGIEVAVRLGEAVVAASGHTLYLKGGQRSLIAPGEPPQGPLPLGKDLLVNGDFQDGLYGWTKGHIVEEGPAGEVAIVSSEGGRALRFLRQGARKHGENYVVQYVNRDVSDFQWLELSLDMKLVHQSLSGGGVRGSEYPLHIRLKYRDANGREHTWIKEFYYQNTVGHPTSIYSEEKSPNTWFRFRQNLLDPDVGPRPFYLYELIIAASGHDYESWVENVKLVGQ